MTITPEQRKADLVDRLATEAQKRVGDDRPTAPRHSSGATSRSSLPTTSSTPRSRRSSAARFRSGSSASSASSARRKSGSSIPPSKRTAGASSTPSSRSSTTTCRSSSTPSAPRSTGAAATSTCCCIRSCTFAATRAANATKLTVDAGSDERRHRRVVHARRDRSGDRCRRSSRRSARRSRTSCAKCALAVTDWRAMREQLRADVAELEHAKLADAAGGSERSARVPAVARRRQLHLPRISAATDSKRATARTTCRAVPETGLGILREMRTESAARGAAPLTPEFSEYARTQRSAHHHQGQQPQHRPSRRCRSTASASSATTTTAI